MSEILALLDGREVGTVRQSRGRLGFTYADSWRAAPGAYPLSLSMPLAAAAHPHRAIDAYLWGLLPDNEFILRRWAQHYHVSPRNAFALIAEVGEDCAGAVQFVRPERRDALLGGHAAIAWLTEAEVADRLRALQADASAGRAPQDTGHFSLAGAQPKTALCFDGQRWGVPSGREPTTHIIKPQTGEFDGHAENEHLCLALARALGLPTAHSEVRWFEDVTAIVVERYDRVQVARLAAAKGADASVSASAQAEFSGATASYRVHQEDLCQALAVHPSLKYQNDGGPGPREIIGVLRAHAAGGRPEGAHDSPTAYDEDESTFLDALILNWLIGGTDAHAKNYSVLIGGRGAVRLAPLYDLASIYGYATIDPEKARLAMKIGDEYRLRDIGLTQWRKFAVYLRRDAATLVDRIRGMAAELPDRLADVVRQLSATGVTHRVLETLSRELPRRAAAVVRM